MKFAICLAHVIFITASGDQLKTRICTGSGTSFDGNAPENLDCQSVILNEKMKAILGFGSDGEPPLNLKILAESPQKIFHEGPVLFEERHEIYFVTNRLGKDTNGLDQYIDLMKYNVRTGKVEKVDAKIPMGNGMTKSVDGDKLLICSQGYNTTGGAIMELDLDSLETRTVVSTYFGRPFNSPNDVDVASNGDIYFTDPIYGFLQGFRAGVPKMGNHIYSYNPKSDQLLILSDSLERPNGIALDEEAGLLFVTDSAYFDGPPWTGSYLHANSIYSIEIKPNGAAIGGHYRKMLFNSVGDIQDGIAVYKPGNLLFSAGGGGIEIWDLCTNEVIGLIYTPKGDRGVTQILLPKVPGKQTVYGFSETILWSIDLIMPAVSSCKMGKSSTPATLLLSSEGTSRVDIALCLAVLNLFGMSLLAIFIYRTRTLRKREFAEFTPQRYFPMIS